MNEGIPDKSRLPLISTPISTDGIVDSHNAFLSAARSICEFKKGSDCVDDTDTGEVRPLSEGRGME